MIKDTLEVATDPDYRFELAIQLGRLEIAKVSAFEELHIPRNIVCPLDYYPFIFFSDNRTLPQ